MDNMLYDILFKYFTVLSKTGNIGKNDTEKVLLITVIYDLISNDYRGCLTEEDYSTIRSLLYRIFGTSCIIGYYEIGDFNTDSEVINMGEIGNMFTMSVSEIAHRLNSLEENASETNSRLDTIEDTDVLDIVE